MKLEDWPPSMRVLATLSIGSAGGAFFWVLHLPAPWLSGAMVAMVTMVSIGLRPHIPDWLRDFGLLMAGMITGSAITPEMIKTVWHYPVSIAILAITTWAIVVCGQGLLTRFFGWDGRNAFLASVPGALSAVIATTTAIGGDMTRVVTLQAFRLFVLITLLPSAVMMTLQEAPQAGASTIAAGGLAIVAFGSLIAAHLFERLGILAPYFLGGMVATGAYFGVGLSDGSPPSPIAAFAMVLVGIYAGSRFADLRLAILRSLFVPSLALFLVSTGIAVIGGIVAAQLARIPIADALVAFAPGGLEAMVLLGLAMGLDPLYVSAHHVTRFVMISLAVPFIARRFMQ